MPDLNLPPEFDSLGLYHKSVSPPSTSGYRKKGVNVVGQIIRIINNNNYSIKLIINLSRIRGHDAGENNLFVNLSKSDFDVESLQLLAKNAKANALAIIESIDMKYDASYGTTNRNPWAGFSTYTTKVRFTSQEIKSIDQISTFTVYGLWANKDDEEHSADYHDNIFRSVARVLIESKQESQKYIHLKDINFDMLTGSATKYILLTEIISIRNNDNSRSPTEVFVTDYTKNLIFTSEYHHRSDSMTYTSTFKNYLASLCFWKENEKEFIKTNLKPGMFILFGGLSFSEVSDDRQAYYNELVKIRCDGPIKETIRPINTTNFSTLLPGTDLKKEYLSLYSRRQQYIEKYERFSEYSNEPAIVEETSPNLGRYQIVKFPEQPALETQPSFDREEEAILEVASSNDEVQQITEFKDINSVLPLNRISSPIEINSDDSDVATQKDPVPTNITETVPKKRKLDNDESKNIDDQTSADLCTDNGSNILCGIKRNKETMFTSLKRFYPQGHSQEHLLDGKVFLIEGLITGYAPSTDNIKDWYAIM